MSAIQAVNVPAGNDVRSVRAEHRAALRERMFQRIDRDGSGGITRQEFANALQNLPGAGNGRGASDVASARAAAVMAQIDSNGDGQVSSGELDSALNRREATRGARGESPNTEAVGNLLVQLSSQSHGLRDQNAASAARQYAQAAARRT